MKFYRYTSILLIALFFTVCGSPRPAESATKAQSIQFLLSQVRASGVALSGGKVDFYEAGATTTRKTVWIDRNKATAAANPYTLDSNGTAQLYGDGLYRIVIKDSAGVTKYDRDYINVKDIREGLAYDAADYVSLAAAVTAIGSTPATLQYSSNQTLAANLTIPATLELMPLNGAVINHGAYTITYNGDTSRWPLAQIFNGTGTVTFGANISLVEAIWFQANTTPGTTDMLAALNKALASIGDWRGATIPIRAYAVSDTLLVKNKSVTLKGFGWGQDTPTTGSYLKWIGAAGSPILQVENCQGAKVSNFRLIGNSAAKPSAGLRFLQSAGEGNDYNTFERLYIGAASWDSTHDYDVQIVRGILLESASNGSGGFVGGNDSNKWDMIKINQCQIGVDNQNSQGLIQHFSNLFVWYASEAGVKTKANLTGNNWFFAMNAVDIMTYDSSERPVIDIQGFNAEASGRMLELTANGVVHIHGGYWQATLFETSPAWARINADWKWIKADQNAQNAVILEDFELGFSSPYTGETPLVSMKAESGGEARNVFKWTGKIALQAANIDMQPVNSANNEAVIDITGYGSYTSPYAHWSNHLLPVAEGDIAVDDQRQDVVNNLKLQKSLQHKIQALADSATPSVADGSVWLTGGTTTITNFTDGVVGQVITILAEHSVTITDGTNIFLAGSANFNMVSTGSLTLIQKADGKWYETSRSVN